MAKRAVRSTTSRRAIDSVKTGAIPDTAATSRPNGHPTEDEVRVRAYHRYLERGATDGGDLEDWVEAEKELGLERRS
jgi:hypothetical protein